jgi:FkbM family methyltransferase
MTVSKSMLRGLKQALRACGIAVARYPPPHTYERGLLSYFEAMRINCVLDIGAYDGRYASNLRRIGFKGRIISFEPVPASFALLQAKMRGDSGWAGYNVGLSNETRQSVINTYGRGDFNSLLQLRTDTELAYELDPAKRSSCTIQLRRLDEMLGEITAGMSDLRIFAKLDTQGHDVEAIRGSSGVIDMITGFQSEMSVVPLYDGMLSIAEALEIYRGMGFVPIGFYPVNSFDHLQITPEFDVMFNRYQGALYVPGVNPW